MNIFPEWWIGRGGSNSGHYYFTTLHEIAGVESEN
jgi:hypothetical protein